MGFTGSIGSQGIIGFTGSQGAIGFSGSEGTQGVIGFTGSKGDTGEDGSSVTIIGSVPNSGSLDPAYPGNIGDGFIAQDTGSLWVWDGAQWNDVGQFVGYTGSQGNQGIIGFDGSRGVVGFTGSQGDQGIIGFTGSQGGTGFSGSQGDTGTNGFNGSRGDIGFTDLRATLEQMDLTVAKAIRV